MHYHHKFLTMAYIVINWLFLEHYFFTILGIPLFATIILLLLCTYMNGFLQQTGKIMFYDNKKCLWNMYAPPNDLWPRNPKFNKGHLLVMTNHHTKFEDPWAMSSLVIGRTRFVYRRTYRLTYRPTCAKAWA